MFLQAIKACNSAFYQAAKTKANGFNRYIYFSPFSDFGSGGQT
jgi:hypothetical protein